MYGTQLIGTYFIDTSKRTGLNSYQIQAIDGIGVLDNYTFMGGIYVNKNVEDLIDEIFDNIYITYTIANELKNLTVTGYLPICTAPHTSGTFKQGISTPLSAISTSNDIATASLENPISHLRLRRRRFTSQNPPKQNKKPKNQNTLPMSSRKAIH